MSKKWRRDFKFKIMKSIVTPRIEEQLQRLRDINVEVVYLDDDASMYYGGEMPVDSGYQGDTYPPDVYKILLTLYRVIREEGH